MPHLSFPITVGPTGRLLSLGDDSPRAVAQSVALLLATRPGERRSVPEYGLTDPLFTPHGADEAAIAQAVADWEPRATPADIAVAHAGIAQTVTVHPREDTA